MDELEEILKTIEELRQQLERLFTAKGIIDQEVMAASQILDAVVNEYYRLLKRKTAEGEKFKP